MVQFRLKGWRFLLLLRKELFLALCVAVSFAHLHCLGQLLILYHLQSIHLHVSL